MFCAFSINLAAQWEVLLSCNSFFKWLILGFTCVLVAQKSTAELSALKCNQIISNSLILLSFTDVVILIVFTLPEKSTIKILWSDMSQER